MLLPEALLKTSLVKGLETQWTPVRSLKYCHPSRPFRAVVAIWATMALDMHTCKLIIIQSPLSKAKKHCHKNIHSGLPFIKCLQSWQVLIQPMPTLPTSSEIQTQWSSMTTSSWSRKNPRLRRASLASICVSEKSDSDGGGATIPFSLWKGPVWDHYCRCGTIWSLPIIRFQPIFYGNGICRDASIHL